MAPMPNPDPPGRAASGLALSAALTSSVALGLALVLAACGSSATPASSASSGPGASASLSPSPGPSQAPTIGPSQVASPSVAPSPSVGATETEWGTIWDAVPPTFPIYDGATPVEPNEPASLAYDVDVPAATVTTDLQAELETVGFSTIALSGPFEDGSMVIDSAGDPPGCEVQTTIAPLGATTRVTVLYGVDCPAG